MLTNHRLELSNTFDKPETAERRCRRMMVLLVSITALTEYKLGFISEQQIPQQHVWDDTISITMIFAVKLIIITSY